MKLCIRLALFLLPFLNASAFAAFPSNLSLAELGESSDLVIIGTPFETKDRVGDLSSLGLVNGKFQGVETIFKVLSVTKGDLNTNRIIFHYYRDVNDTNGITDKRILAIYSEAQSYNFSGYECARPGGPVFLRFISPSTNEFVLYLKREGSLYAPVAGQLFSYNSVRRVGDAHTISPWHP